VLCSALTAHLTSPCPHDGPCGRGGQCPVAHAITRQRGAVNSKVCRSVGSAKKENNRGRSRRRWRVKQRWIESDQSGRLLLLPAPEQSTGIGDRRGGGSAVLRWFFINGGARPFLAQIRVAPRGPRWLFTCGCCARLS
jgi:hypothetical protein